ncbi:hypothetical protein Goari_010322, partial [Gossypium aridum]|nr:hypothetical protein [Gossypium aridum]
KFQSVSKKNTGRCSLSRCSEDFETNIHASCDCPLALQVWQELGINWRVNQTEDSMTNWVQQLFSGAVTNKK